MDNNLEERKKRSGKRERREEENMRGKKEENQQEKRKNSVKPSSNLLDSKGMGHEAPFLFSLRPEMEMKKKTLRN